MGERMPEEYLTIGEAAAYLQRPVQTLYRWRVQGYGPPAAKVGRALLYRRSEIDRWMREQEREPVGRAR
jgi:excisionase family DNA binding protein